MSESRTVEARLEAVERDIAELRGLVQPASAKHPWYERMVGSMKDYPEFADVVRLGRELRKAVRDPAEPAE